MPQLLDAVQSAFQYPLQVHLRRHGPLGYLNYQSFKPWLRDEFQFRCVYCLWRERWHAVGEDTFGVDHLQPRAEAPNRICDYDNLVYACCRCNSVKIDARRVLDPCEEPFGDHLEVSPDGAIQGLTLRGRELIETCQLARPRIIEARRRLLILFHILHESNDPRSAALLAHYFSYPDNLPMLSFCALQAATPDQTESRIAQTNKRASARYRRFIEC
jgi:hypothetical protein